MWWKSTNLNQPTHLTLIYATISTNQLSQPTNQLNQPTQPTNQLNQPANGSCQDLPRNIQIPEVDSLHLSRRCTRTSYGRETFHPTGFFHRVFDGFWSELLVDKMHGFCEVWRIKIPNCNNYITVGENKVKSIWAVQKGMFGLFGLVVGDEILPCYIRINYDWPLYGSWFNQTV